MAIFAIVAGAGTPASGTEPQANEGDLGAPVWSDEFDGEALDRTKWSYRANGDRHPGFRLTPDAVSVNDGVLTIKTYTDDGMHYAGMISTDPRETTPGFELKYGRFEARMKFHTSPGQWSAFWLQSATIGELPRDPERQGVEMDVAEHRVRCPQSTAQPDCGRDADVSDRVQQALIWGGYGDDRLSWVQLSDPLDGLGNDSWHTFAMEWSPAKVTFFYDGVETWSVSGPISRRAQYLILSSEVGEFFAGDIPSEGYGSRETSTTNVQVDWVRVWNHVKGAVAPAIVTAPRVSGAAKVGGALACSPGSWTGDPAPAQTYAWLSDGVALDGATGPSYIVRAGDRGHALACRVTASNSAGAVSAQSNALLIPLPSEKVAPTVAVTMACPICRATVVSATALSTIRVPRVGRTPARTYTPATRATTSARGKAVKIALRLVRTMRGAIIRALLAHKPIDVVLGVRLKDSAGAAGTVTWRVALRL